MAYIPTPYSTQYSKSSPGLSDVTVQNGVFKFMGCTIVSVDVTLGFNSTASSATVTLVEDTDQGDSFVIPTIPSIHAISLPKNISKESPVSPTITNDDLQPSFLYDSDLPFYFCGIVTSYQKDVIKNSGKYIQVSLADPRECLRGVQCLLGGFALSHNVTGGTPRYADSGNVIDVFGYFDYGMTSGRNDFGMTWSSVKQALEGVGVDVHGMRMEFWFSGNGFMPSEVPSSYRIDDEMIDLLSLCTKVCEDGGSDMYCYARKVGNQACVLEFKSIVRNNTVPLTELEITDFIEANDGYVEEATRGFDFRNEPNSSIIIGGFRNKNYVAYPSEYKSEFHLVDDNGTNKEDYNAFPDDIQIRLFGGTWEKIDDTNSTLATVSTTTEVNAGSIYPYWGFADDNLQYPLIHPFVPFDSFVYGRSSAFNAEIESKFPLCIFAATSLSVREVAHAEAFLSGDDASDSRPFAYLSSWKLQAANETGWVRGLPLNTDILNAALISEQDFYSTYRVYYPTIADSLGFAGPAFDEMELVSLDPNFNIKETLLALPISNSLFAFTQAASSSSPNSNGFISKSSLSATITKINYELTLSEFRTFVWETVKGYAEEHMGKQYIVCLPRSEIMNRIWNGDAVPTNTNKPQIEYRVDDYGYWEVVPSELDGVYNGSSSVFTANEEAQIQNRFQGEDGRFEAMAVVDIYPQGNGSFYANGQNRIDISKTDPTNYRPVRFETTPNPPYLFVACSVSQFETRPDLALVQLPESFGFDPDEDNPQEGANFSLQQKNNRKNAILRYYWRVYKKDQGLRNALQDTLPGGYTLDQWASEVIEHWAKRYLALFDENVFDGQREVLLDLRAVSIPLSSTIVSYGPWYKGYSTLNGDRDILVKPELVPWNFARSEPWYTNLDAAGNEILENTVSTVNETESATIVIAGYPQYGVVDALGFNSHVTGMSISFGSTGVKTTYSLSTYHKKPGTFRKVDTDILYNNYRRARKEIEEFKKVDLRNRVKA